MLHACKQCHWTSYGSVSLACDIWIEIYKQKFKVRKTKNEIHMKPSYLNDVLLVECIQGVNAKGLNLLHYWIALGTVLLSPLGIDTGPVVDTIEICSLTKDGQSKRIMFTYTPLLVIVLLKPVFPDTELREQAFNRHICWPIMLTGTLNEML